MIYLALTDVCLLHSTTICLLSLTKLVQQLMSTQEDNYTGRENIENNHLRAKISSFSH